MKKKYHILSLVLIIISVKSAAQVTWSFKDSRDGKSYKTITIGTQTWMAENLAFKASSGCWAYENKEINVRIYGYLYNWETANKSCPTGWHVPSNDEWNELTNFLGGDVVAGGKLKANIGWKENGNGTGEIGFKSCPGGLRRVNPSEFMQLGYFGWWWTSDKHNQYNSFAIMMSCYDNECKWENYPMGHGNSVRCLKDKQIN